MRAAAAVAAAAVAAATVQRSAASLGSLILILGSVGCWRGAVFKAALPPTSGLFK